MRTGVKVDGAYVGYVEALPNGLYVGFSNITKTSESFDSRYAAIRHVASVGTGGLY